MISRILTPVDFSPLSRDALKYAVELAQTLHSSLYLLHVVEPLTYPADWLEGLVDTEAIDRILSEQSMHSLKRLRDEVVRSEIPTTLEIRFGYPADVILEYAREIQADLICLAPRGHSPLERILLGSTTEKIIRNAFCPVLVYRPKSAP